MTILESKGETCAKPLPLCFWSAFFLVGLPCRVSPWGLHFRLHFTLRLHACTAGGAGLEFDDVFIWDFFADSRADAEWRVVLNFLDTMAAPTGEGMDEAPGSGAGKRHKAEVTGMLRPLEFAEREHQILCEVCVRVCVCVCVRVCVCVCLSVCLLSSLPLSLSLPASLHASYLDWAVACACASVLHALVRLHLLAVLPQVNRHWFCFC